MNIPVIIIAFNNLTYVKMMVDQSKSKKFNDIHIIDNCSFYPKLLEYYKNIKDVKVHYMPENFGHRVLFRSVNKKFYDELPKFFILTDPDIKFNDNLPDDFVNKLCELTQKYKVGKAGFALSIEDHHKFKNLTFTRFKKKKTIREWEQVFWNDKLEDNVYKAGIDTTFAVYNKEYFRIVKNESKFLNAVRVSGNFTAKHLPWYKETIVSEEEILFYNNNSKCSFWGY